jgi:protein transport protein SEC31
VCVNSAKPADNARFNDIAWSLPSEQHPRGIIAGALDSGALVLWDAEKLLKGVR